MQNKFDFPHPPVHSKEMSSSNYQAMRPDLDKLFAEQRTINLFSQPCPIKSNLLANTGLHDESLLPDLSELKGKLLKAIDDIEGEINDYLLNLSGNPDNTRGILMKINENTKEIFDIFKILKFSVIARSKYSHLLRQEIESNKNIMKKFNSCLNKLVDDLNKNNL